MDNVCLVKLTLLFCWQKCGGAPRVKFAVGVEGVGARILKAAIVTIDLANGRHEILAESLGAELLHERQGDTALKDARASVIHAREEAKLRALLEEPRAV